MDLMLEALLQSIFFFPLAVGIYLSYAILQTTDLSSEGSFVLGGAVFARLFTLEINIIVSAIASILMGALAGMGVAAIQVKERIHSLIAGIIGLFMLYTLNFEILGRPNIGLHNLVVNKASLFLFIALATLLVLLIISSRIGLLLRAFGSNKQLLTALGKNIEFYRFFGLGLSNAMAAFAGLVAALINGYADLNMGFGMTLTGIGTVMIGKQLLKRFLPQCQFHAVLELAAAFVGVYLYFLAVNGFLSFGLNPMYLKFLLGLLLIVLLRRKIA